MINCSRLMDQASLNIINVGKKKLYLSKKGPIIFYYPLNYPSRQKVQSRDLLSTQECLDLFDEANNMDTPFITMESEDPLERDDLVDIISYGSKNGIKIVVAMSHRFITESRVKVLKNAGTSYIGVNLDEKFSGNLKENFRRCLRNLQYLKNEAIPFGIKLYLKEFDEDELAEALDCMQLNGVKRVAFYQLPPKHREWERFRNNRRRLMDFLLECAMNKFDMDFATENIYADGPYIYNYAVNKLKNFELGKKILLSLSKQGGCKAGEKIIGIGPTGDIHPCPTWIDFSVGNIKDKGIAEVVRENNICISNGKIKVGMRCMVCDFRNICRGCRYRMYTENGDVQTINDPACYLTDNEINIEKK